MSNFREPFRINQEHLAMHSLFEFVKQKAALPRIKNNEDLVMFMNIVKD